MKECKFFDGFKGGDEIKQENCPDEATHKFMGWDCCKRHYDILKKNQ